jgi:hypothetical protein
MTYYVSILLMLYKEYMSLINLVFYPSLMLLEGNNSFSPSITSKWQGLKILNNLW